MTITKRLLGRRLSILSLLVLLALVIGSVLWWQRRGPQPATEIFAGIVYGCERLVATEEGSGLLHWVRVDLAAPGIEPQGIVLRGRAWSKDNASQTARKQAAECDQE